MFRDAYRRFIYQWMLYEIFLMTDLIVMVIFEFFFLFNCPNFIVINFKICSIMRFKLKGIELWWGTKILNIFGSSY